MAASSIADAIGAPPVTLRARLQHARAARFVGRKPELELWQRAIASPAPASSVFWVHGPGGVGKSSLLRRFADLARAAGVSPLWLDARSLPAEQQPFVAMIRRSLGIGDDVDPWQRLRDGARRVLLIDTAELLGPLEDWLREDVLPELPEQCLVVFASRQAPGAAWLGDDGWAGLLTVQPLRNFAPEDARALLHARGVPEQQHGRVLARSHGHPLALSLLADLIAGGADWETSESSPHVVTALLQRFVRELPRGPRRKALYATAHARAMNEALLRHVLPEHDSAELYDWLQSLSFAQPTPDGLSLHDLAAEALDADLRRRDLGAYVDLHTQLRRHALELVQGPSPSLRRRGATDLCWMYRFSPIARPLVDWSTLHSLYTTPVSGEDAEHLLAATLRLQGPQARAARAHWLGRRPDAFHMVRASPRRAIGFIFSLLIDHLDAEAARVDAALRAAFDYVERTAPLRPGELLHLLDAFDYDHPHGMPRHAWLQVEGTLRWHGTPQLGWSFVQVGRRASAVVLPLLAQFRHVPGPTVEVGGKPYVLAGHDWRREPSSMLSERLADVQLYGSLAEHALDDPLLVLSQEAFADAVRAGLRNYGQPLELGSNPLCRSRLVSELPVELVDTAELAHVPAATARLGGALRAAVHSLAAGTRDQKLFQILIHTYLQPAPSQDIAAELVGLPFSTYRRHLGAALARTTEWLWQREVAGWASDLPAPPLSEDRRRP